MFDMRACVEFLDYEDGKPTQILLLESLVWLPIPITVPAGFISDGASIPRWAWRAIGHPFDARWIRSALLHDYLCRTRKLSSRETHDLFYKTMRWEKNSWLRATMMRAAVVVANPEWP